MCPFVCSTEPFVGDHVVFHGQASYLAILPKLFQFNEQWSVIPTQHKKPVTTMLTYPWKCTVLHCNHLGNTWKPLVLMTRHFDYCSSAREGDNQSVRSSAPVVSRCFPGGYNVKLYISRGRLAWWLLAFLHSATSHHISLSGTTLHPCIKWNNISSFKQIALIPHPNTKQTIIVGTVRSTFSLHMIPHWLKCNLICGALR